MLFNSFEFLLFLPTVFAAYWILNLWTERPRGLQAQNLLLLIASYLFYGWWDWRFLSLIVFSTLVDFAVGIQIAQANAREISADADELARSRSAKRWLWVSLAVNLGLLGYFKYANFFIENWIEAWSAVGVHMDPWSLKVILPVGISFYTFQTLSYSIDIYRRRLQPTRNLIEFAAFVSFFPQLVAGPIERASALLPQIASRRKFDYPTAVSGLRLILWGLFKKVVVADTCAIYVNDVFANDSDYSGPTLMMGAVFFAFQIYGDFSGYSDIAIGTARLFGIKLMTNFRMPYFSRDIAEFWRRWHISLSTWFRDYLYIPLGGSRVGKWKAVRNTFIIFLVSGFWHGANWTFIVWGLIHAFLFLPLLLRGRNRQHTDDIQGGPSAKELRGMIGTFFVVTVAWVFFRADSLTHALQFLSRWVDMSGANPTSQMLVTSLVLAAAVVGDWLLQRGRFYPKPKSLRWGLYLAIATCVVLGWNDEANQFIYFQF
jgi:alginate O-acetyltransferase complex protein AlgI